MVSSYSPQITQVTLLNMTPLSLKLTNVGTPFEIDGYTKSLVDGITFTLHKEMLVVYSAWTLQLFIC